MEQAFELTDASAERSAAGCTVKLNKAPVIEYLQSNIVLMKNMIADGYEDKRALERRIKAMEAWLADPQLLEADANAEYAAVIDINMDDIQEPIIASRMTRMTSASSPSVPGRRSTKSSSARA